MTDPGHLQVEVTVRRIDAPRLPISTVFVPRVHHMTTTGQWTVGMSGQQYAGDYATVGFDGFHPVGDNWFCGRLDLTVNGSRISSYRPFLYYNEPCDIPMYCTPPSPHAGTWVVGLRSTAR